MGATPWDARTYDRSSQPQQAWAADVLARLEGIAPDATVLDVGCGTGRVTEVLLEFVPRGRVLAVDASPEMVELARARLGARARVWRGDALELALDEPVDAIVSTAAFHWVPDHDRLWARLADALTPGGVLEIQCGGDGNIWTTCA
ncbi:MAG TPA: methyltransferase domain-containing protein [Solirubrobacteraceae bacterium]|nr:methyltransferase domain-containing protein [Solirubrobacteraceae bacterium]